MPQGGIFIHFHVLPGEVDMCVCDYLQITIVNFAGLCFGAQLCLALAFLVRSISVVKTASLSGSLFVDSKIATSFSLASYGPISRSSSGCT